MGSFPQLKPHRLEDVTNIYIAILLPVVLQVSWKTGKAENKEAFIHDWKHEKVTKRCLEKIAECHTHSWDLFETQSNI